MSLPKAKKIEPPAAAPPIPKIEPPTQQLGGDNPKTAAAIRKRAGRSALRINTQTGAAGVSALRIGTNVARG